MRLSEVLTRAPKTESLQVENFMGHKRLVWGKQKKVEIGRVFHNYYCMACNDVQTYQSDLELTCLMAGDDLISIDVVLKCLRCESSVEAWYLVKCVDDLFAMNPTVYLVRFTENRRGSARGIAEGAGEFAELLDQAEVAYSNRLGAGSMIYLRKIFEMITMQVATATGIATVGRNGGRKPFKNLLEEVDREHKIIPSKFSQNGYRLFSELSEVIHGNSLEEDALLKYPPCRQLVLSIVKNVREDAQIAGAIDDLGWDVNDLDSIAGEEILQ